MQNGDELNDSLSNSNRSMGNETEEMTIEMGDGINDLK